MWINQPGTLLQAHPYCVAFIVLEVTMNVTEKKNSIQLYPPVNTELPC